MTPFLLVLAAYLLGATPTSHAVGRYLYGVDLREKGSGNLGATNTFRVLGWKAAVPVVTVDIAKGWLPVWLFPAFVAGAWEWRLAFGAAAILGHVFSFWIGFRGGKGVATSAGVFLALSPLGVGAALAVWMAAVFSTRIVSLGSILAAVTLPIVVFFRPGEGGGSLVAFTFALALFVIWAHRSNIGRLLRGEENRFGSRDGPVDEGASHDPVTGGPG